MRLVLWALALLVGALPAASEGQAAGRIPVLVLTGEDQEHDWRWTSTTLRQVLEESGRFRVEISIWPGAALSNPYDVERYSLFVIDYDGARWGEPAEANLLAAVRAGAGLAVLHAANRAFPDWAEWQELVGEPWGEESGHDLFTSVDVDLVDRRHAITAGLESWKEQADGLLHGLSFDAETHHTLATARSDRFTGGSGADEPVVVIGRYGEGRIFQTTLGHVGYGDERTWASWRDPRFQRLLVRGADWAATGDVRPVAKVAHNTLTEADRAAGWKLLFDGESLTGWAGFGDGTLLRDRWQVEDGTLKVLAGAGNMFTSESYTDFEFELEWRTAEGAVSALAYHLAKDEAGQRLHLQFPLEEDPASLEEARVALGVLPKAARVLRPPGEFNHARIVAYAGYVEHWLNGIRILTLDRGAAEWAEELESGAWRDDPALSRLPLGRIALQDSGVDVWFRNVKIRPLPAPIQDAAAPSTPTPRTIALFDGRDLTGWQESWWNQKPVGLWNIGPDGVLVCKGFALGYQRTEADFQDFVLELDYRFNPVTRQGGQGGVLVRMQGDGFYPPCLEVRLERRNAGTIWNHGDFPMDPDPRRTNGRVTSKTRDAENDLGEWNRLEIRAEGAVLRVLLNGEQVNEIHGVAALAGGIGIKSEGVEMHYRDIRLTPLP